MTARLKLDFHGLWLGVYAKREIGRTYFCGDRTRYQWRRRVCVALVPFVTLVLYGRWRNDRGQVLQ